ncbi:hypothetical protein DFH09DRAFT_1114647 [Mycena vulgaris]|nr:hypothetical protein DFH09DRAFT_1114647 [Mycena vulgaris]
MYLDWKKHDATGRNHSGAWPKKNRLVAIVTQSSEISIVRACRVANHARLAIIAPRILQLEQENGLGDSDAVRELERHPCGRSCKHNTSNLSAETGTGLLQRRLGAYAYPVLALPNEIVSKNFVVFLPLYPKPPSTIGLLSPLLLGEICRECREITLTAPALWRMAEVYFRNKLAAQQLFLLETYLKRSGSSSLSIKLDESGTREVVPTRVASIRPCAYYREADNSHHSATCRSHGSPPPLCPVASNGQRCHRFPLTVTAFNTDKKIDVSFFDKSDLEAEIRSDGDDESNSDEEPEESDSDGESDGKDASSDQDQA